MTRSQRLNPLLRVTQQRQDTVAKMLAERDKTLAEQQQRLDMLKEYEDEDMINEDEHKRGKQELENLTHKFIARTDELGARKEREIMEM